MGTMIFLIYLKPWLKAFIKLCNTLIVIIAENRINKPLLPDPYTPISNFKTVDPSSTSPIRPI